MLEKISIFHSLEGEEQQLTMPFYDNGSFLVKNFIYPPDSATHT